MRFKKRWQHFRVVCTGGLVLALLSACSHQQPMEKLQFPADESFPFLTLEKVYTGKVDAGGSWGSRLQRLLAGDCPQMPLHRPTGVAVDAQGQIFVVDTELGRVLRFSGPEGDCHEVTEFGMDVLKMPVGIAITADAIFVSDVDRGLIQVFNHTLQPTGTITHEAFVRPSQLKYDTVTQRLLVVDPPSHQIFIFSTDGTFMAALGGLGTAPTQFHYPVGVDTDQNGKIFVLDGLNRKTKIFSPELAWLSEFGTYDRTPGSFGFPKGIAISSDGYIFVSDAAFGNIQIFNQQGALLYFFGQTGWRQGEFMLPGAIGFDDRERLYVVDQYNNRIQVFQYYAQP